MTFFGNIVYLSLVVSFAALALRSRAANDTTRAQINNIPSESHFIVLFKRSRTVLKTFTLKSYHISPIPKMAAVEIRTWGTSTFFMV